MRFTTIFFTNLFLFFFFSVVSCIVPADFSVCCSATGSTASGTVRFERPNQSTGGHHHGCPFGFVPPRRRPQPGLASSLPRSGQLQSPVQSTDAQQIQSLVGCQWNDSRHARWCLIEQLLRWKRNTHLHRIQLPSNSRRRRRRRRNSIFQRWPPTPLLVIVLLRHHGSFIDQITTAPQIHHADTVERNGRRHRCQRRRPQSWPYSIKQQHQLLRYVPFRRISSSWKLHVQFAFHLLLIDFVCCHLYTILIGYSQFRLRFKILNLFD